MKITTWFTLGLGVLAIQGCEDSDAPDGVFGLPADAVGGQPPAPAGVAPQGVAPVAPPALPPAGVAGAGPGPVGVPPTPVLPPAGNPPGNPPGMVGIDTGIGSMRGKCNINSGYPGDEACLAAPDPSVGIQIHVGPNDYNDTDEVSMFLMQPGDESSQCFADLLPNMEAFHYLQFELSGRPGTHHIINSVVRQISGRGFIPVCESFGENRVSSLPGASKPHMEIAPVAPENANLGIPVEGNLAGQFDMHYFNFTDEPILREFWLNLYFVDPADVEETPLGVVGFGGLGWNFNPIQPGTMQVYQYECPIDTDGRILQLLGHTHAHGDRFTSHIRRANGERIKVFEAFDYLEPRVFNYNSVAQNPGFAPGAAGAYTGILEVSAGDVLEWECEVNNDSNVPLRYTNFVETGEMCNIWGQAVGPSIGCFLQ